MGMSYLIFEITDPVTSKKHPVILAGGGSGTATSCCTTSR